MRIAATAATLLFALAACSTTSKNETIPYQQPNSLMAGEITQRIEQIPYQHREELLQNLLWLAQTGEQTIPGLLEGLRSDNPKVRSSCCWVLGRIRDRRTIPNLQALVSDSESSVRMEAARTLVLMGDLKQSPKLIEGLDSERKEVRFMCHEALKTATGHDFAYDHLESDQQNMHVAVLRWRQWWGEYSGDQYFAASYERAHGLNNLAAPGGETQMQDGGSKPASQGSDTTSGQTSPDGETSAPQSTQPQSTGPQSNKPQSTNNQSTNNQSTVDQSPNNPSTNPAPAQPQTNPPSGVVEPAGNGQQGGEAPVTPVPSTTGPGANGNGTSDPAVVELPVVEVPVVEVPAGEPSTKPTPKPAGNGGSGDGGQR